MIHTFACNGHSATDIHRSWKNFMVKSTTHMAIDDSLALCSSSHPCVNHGANLLSTSGWYCQLSRILATWRQCFTQCFIQAFHVLFVPRGSGTPVKGEILHQPGSFPLSDLAVVRTCPDLLSSHCLQGIGLVSYIIYIIFLYIYWTIYLLNHMYVSTLTS